MNKPFNRTFSARTYSAAFRLRKELKLEAQYQQQQNQLPLNKNSPQAITNTRHPLQPLHISENSFQRRPDPKILQSPRSYIFKTHNHKAFFASKSSKTLYSKPPIDQKRKPNTIQTQVSLTSQELYQNHLHQTFQTLKFISALRDPTPLQLVKKQLYLPKKPGFQQKRTLILDLDQTLVHCTSNPQTSDIRISIEFPNGQISQAGINIRPFVHQLLQSANKDFQVILFTASHQCYADKVLNNLDPTGELIHHRLYRDHCLNIDGIHIKDLRIFANRKIEEIVIVDNAAYSFAFQLDNGIPIISWYEDRHDRELFKLIDYLKVLARVVDIRRVNSQAFQLSKFCKAYKG